MLVLYKTPLRHRDANVIGMPKPLRQENRGLEKECECELHCAPQHNYHSSSNPIRFKSATCSNSMGTVQRSKIEDVARSSEDDPSSRRSRDSIFGRAIDHTTLALVRHSLEGWGKGLEEEQLITFKSHIQFSYIAKGVQKKKKSSAKLAVSQPISQSVSQSRKPSRQGEAHTSQPTWPFQPAFFPHHTLSPIPLHSSPHHHAYSRKPPAMYAIFFSFFFLHTCSHSFHCITTTTTTTLPPFNLCTSSSSPFRFLVKVVRK